MNQKAAMELSINTLVIIIISLVILGGGISLLYQFIGGAENIKGQLDEKTDQELERLMVDQGKKVALPLYTATIYRGDTHIFGIGISNIGGVGDEFLIKIQLSKLIGEDGQEISLSETEKEALVQQWVLFNSGKIMIPENDHHKEPLSVTVPENGVNGKYIFNTYVYDAEGKQYGNLQKFYVDVK